ncbi:DUF3800 domain-containing protein [Erythrobacter crassostreae]|uniref:DUF3800 domain-containing protein n=1 Tax=Erythrobacter crassostreae TaxID=2828328 RepID=A0A9X1F401_9SPHN|nr:DUF3800 domain-containing protein [Erythrobacter crassostrea]MBV7258395.1 DUF3800 domain-containing protein [Erythrobacter crassostrea]
MFIHPSKRYRLYIDETGTQSLKKAHIDRFLCLMGIVMLQETHDKSFTQTVFDLKTELFDHSQESPVILHRREMVRGEAPFEKLKSDPFLAMEFERRWTKVVEESAYLAMATAIDKDAHVKKYIVWQHDPYHYCLEMLLERFVKWLKRHNFQGDVLVESRGKFADKRLKAAYQRFWQRGNSTVTAETAQKYLTSKHIKFGRKEDDIAGHQLAVSLAHPVLRYLKTEKLNEPPATGYGARLVDVLKESKLARKPKTDLIDGWGLKWLPS